VNRPASFTHPPRADSAGRPFARAGAAAAIRVMIVDDSLTVRTIFKRMVDSDPALVIVGTASSAERAIALLGETPADVVLLDLEMPGIPHTALVSASCA